jgi:hypothetical protein
MKRRSMNESPSRKAMTLKKVMYVDIAYFFFKNTNLIINALYFNLFLGRDK